MVGRTSWDDSVPLQAAALNIGLDRAAVECAIFNVVTHTIVDGQVRSGLPRILNVEPVDIVRGFDLRRSDPNLELTWQSFVWRRSWEPCVQTELELGEQ